MSQMPIVPATMLLLASTVQGAAQDLPVLGQGNLSCITWTERRTGDAVDAATMTAWALGYLTAYNQYGTDPKEELTRWIDDYCRKNPADSFYGASAALIRRFQETATP